MRDAERFMMPLLTRGLLTVEKLKASMKGSALDALHYETLRLLARCYSGKNPVVLTGFFFPVELLHGHGMTPMFAEFIASAMASTGLEKSALGMMDAEGFPADSCAFHRAALAAFLKGYLPPPDAVAATTHLCDSQSKALEELAVRFGVPLIVLDVPQEDTPEARTYLVRQLEQADGFCSGLSKRRLNHQDWQRIFSLSNQARELMLRVNDIRASSPAGVCGKEVASALIQAQLMFGLPQLPRLLEALAHEILRLSTIAPAVSSMFRLVWLLTFPYFKGNFVPFIERKLGLWPVLDELTYVYWDPLDRERPYESLAAKILQNPGLGPVDRRVKMVEHMVRTANPDGVVHFSHWGCRQGLGGVTAVAESLERLGVPFLELDGDCIDSRSYAEGPTRTRLEGFVEVLKRRNEKLRAPRVVQDGIYAGIDIGSMTAKAVVVDGQGRVLAHTISYTGASARRAAESLLRFLDELSDRYGVLRRCVATGYGRRMVDFADEQVTEITCHARGMWHLFPDVRTIIDIGGQDTKAIAVSDTGNVENFIMNDKCAAGTGRFLELMARALEMDIEELSTMGVRASRSVPISSVCSVFAESEVVSHIAEGQPVESICRGICESVAERTAALLKKVGRRPVIAMTGGVAKNAGVVKALERRLKGRISIAPDPQIIGALGAALIARDGA